MPAHTQVCTNCLPVKLPLGSQARHSAIGWNRRKEVCVTGRLGSAQLVRISNRYVKAATVACSDARGTLPEAQMSDSEHILRLFKGLGISDNDQIHVKSLAELEEHLTRWLETEGTSMTSFKKLLRNHAICLGNFTAYHNQKALKIALRSNPALIVSRKKAKRYKLVKQCLTIL